MLQELKGNIRVFCRVRPLLPDDSPCAEGKVVSYPTTTEALGRGIDLLQNGTHAKTCHWGHVLSLIHI